MTARERLSTEEIRRIAVLARLHLSPGEIDSCREELALVLEHVSRLAELDVDDVEPMSRPAQAVNRFDDDRVGDALSIDELHRNAPVTEDRFFAVPKVLDTEDRS